MVTIRDVARAAGVSTATVSRALNEAALVTDETRRKVMTAIDSLGYRPNAVARGLTTKKTKTIGLIVSDITNPFYPEVARGVEDVLSTYGYNVILCDTDRNPQKELAYINLLIEKRVEGIVFASVPADKTLLTDLDRTGVPWVAAGNSVGGLDHDCVVVDNILGAYQATQHLIRLGHRRIGHLTGPANETVTKERIEGFQRALANQGLDPNNSPIVEADFRQAGGYHAALKMLALTPPITALFVGNDLMAIGVLEAAHERRLEVPKDLAIVGYDDIPIASLHTIQLTTVAQPKSEIGAASSRMLLDKIERIPSVTVRPCTKVVLTPKLIVRRTCGVNLMSRAN